MWVSLHSTVTVTSHPHDCPTLTEPCLTARQTVLVYCLAHDITECQGVCMSLSRLLFKQTYGVYGVATLASFSSNTVSSASVRPLFDELWNPTLNSTTDPDHTINQTRISATLERRPPPPLSAPLSDLWPSAVTLRSLLCILSTSDPPPSPLHSPPPPRRPRDPPGRERCGPCRPPNTEQKGRLPSPSGTLPARAYRAQPTIINKIIIYRISGHEE